MRAVEILIFLLFFALIVWGSVRVMNGTKRAAQIRDGRWQPAVHSLSSGGYRVVVECPGEPSQVVRELPAGMDAAEFSTALAEARSDAEEHAAALNAAR